MKWILWFDYWKLDWASARDDESAPLQGSDICYWQLEHEDGQSSELHCYLSYHRVLGACESGRHRLGWPFLSASRAPVDTSCPNSFIYRIGEQAVPIYGFSDPYILSGDLAHNVYGVTLFPTMIGYGWLRVLPWALAIMNLAHESDYNNAQQQYDLFIGLNGIPPLAEEYLFTCWPQRT